MEHKHMASRVDGNPGGLAKLNARWKLGPALDFLVANG
jgi:hypothetical protein